MDKYEYNLRNEEISTLIGRREFQKAVAIADTIDWTKVRSVKTLCKISDLYKVNKRYKEARILLEQALVRFPNGKNIVSSLCDVCIRMNDIVGAMEYYKQFVQMAPTDNTKFILLYKIYEAQEVTLDERIEVLEGLKKRERIERWCYELATLYHRTGLTSKCVEECDDLILWFREGKYVKKAMELKMLHQQLTQPQDVLYQNMLNPEERAEYIDRTAAHAAIEEKVEVEVEPEEILVKTVDVGQYSTINIQKALEESIKGTLSETSPYQTGNLYSNYGTGTIEQGDDVTKIMPVREADDINYELEANIRQTGNLSVKHADEFGQQEEYYSEELPVQEYADQYGEQPAEYADDQYAEQPAEYADDQYGEQPAVDVQPAVNIQPLVSRPVERPARIQEDKFVSSLQDTAEMQELFFEDPTIEEQYTEEYDDSFDESNTEVTAETKQEIPAIVAPVAEVKIPSRIDDVAKEEKPVSTEPIAAVDTKPINVPKEDVASQVAFPNVPVSGDTIVYNKGDIVNQVASAMMNESISSVNSVQSSDENIVPLANLSNASKEELMELIDRKVAEALENAMKGQSMTENVVPRRDSISQVAPPRSMQKMLSQEYNGQISLVVPEQDAIEKQITGQINLDDYLASWEDTKQQNKQKYEAELKSKLMKETGDLFSDFEAQARDNILAKIDEAPAGTPIDADKEYEEYLKKILADAEKEELPEVEEIEEVEDVAEISEKMAEPEVIPVAVAPVALFDEATPEATDEVEEIEEIEDIEEPAAVSEVSNEPAVAEEITEEPVEVSEVSDEEPEVKEPAADSETESKPEEIIETAPVAEVTVTEPVAEPEEIAEPETVIEAEPVTEAEDATVADSEEIAVDTEENTEEPVTEEAKEQDASKSETVEETAKTEAAIEDAEPVAEDDAESAAEDDDSETEKAAETEAVKEDADSKQPSEENVRDMSEEEIALFSQFFQTKKAKQNLTRALDNISLASYTGNVFVSGEMGEEPVELAKNVVQYAKVSDANFSGKIGKVTGQSLNGKDLAVTVGKMSNGGLIIERAGDMREETIKSLLKVLNQDNLGVLVVMQDTKTEMNKMYNSYPEMNQVFNVQIEIEELSDDALVAFGRKYAERMEYSIDEMGILALHTRIDEMQTSDHVVTVADVRDIVDDAIENATKFSPKHITDIIFGKRYDDDDMIILKERDFIN